MTVYNEFGQQIGSVRIAHGEVYDIYGRYRGKFDYNGNVTAYHGGRGTVRANGEMYFGAKHIGTATLDGKIYGYNLSGNWCYLGRVEGVSGRIHDIAAGGLLFPELPKPAR